VLPKKMSTNPHITDGKSQAKEELHPVRSPAARNEVASTTSAEWQKVGDYFKPHNPDKLIARADIVLPEAKAKSSEQIFSLENAREIVNGKEIALNRNEKLAPGNHLLRFPFEKQGNHKGETGFREALIHIPPTDPANPDKPLPVVFAFHGALPQSMGPQKFRTTLDLDEKADSKGFIVVYPHAELHAIKEGGKPAYTWNVAGAIIPSEDVKRHSEEVGHDDNDFVAGLPKIIQQMTNAAPHEKWGIAAHSQGVAAITQFMTDPRLEGVFPKVVAICGTKEAGSGKEIAKGNAQTVVVINPGGDKTIVPARTDKSGQAISKLFSQASKYVDPTGLGAVNVAAGNPQELITFFIKHLGKTDNLEKLRQVFAPNDPSKSLMSIADYTKRVLNPEPFNPDAISSTDTLNIFDTTSGKRLLVFHAPEANHLILGGNNPAAYNKLSSATVITDLITDSVKLASQ